MRTLYLNGNKIYKRGAKSIAEALTVNQHLCKISLSGNCIGGEGARYIAGAIKVNQTLQEIDLEHCDFQHYDDGTRLLVEAFKFNRSIKTIRFCHTERLATALDFNFTLVSVGSDSKSSLVSTKLSRNRKLANLFKQIQALVTKGFNGEEIEHLLNDLAVIIKTEQLTEDMPIIEQFTRLLTGLGHMTLNTPGIGVDIMTCLAPAFSNPELQAIGNFVLGNALVNDSRFSCLVTEIRYGLALYYLRDYLHRPEVRNSAYIAFWRLTRRRDITVSELIALQKSTAIVKYVDFLKIVYRCLHNDPAEISLIPADEINFLTELSTYQDFQPEVILLLMQSPAFVKACREQYPKTKELIIAEYCYWLVFKKKEKILSIKIPETIPPAIKQISNKLEPWSINKSITSLLDLVIRPDPIVRRHTI